MRDLISFSFRRRALMGVIFLLATTALPLWADEDKPDPATIWKDWCSEPFSVVLLLLTAAWYALGLFRIRSASPRAIRNLDVICFAAGWLVLFIALCSPLHPLGELLFSAHMIQHELLMLAAAPLLVLARPLPVFLFALPRRWAAAIARASKWRPWQRTWSFLTNPLSAWIIHAAVLWSWHAPFLFQAATENEWVHVLQHASFFGSALLFWWAVVHGRRRALSFGMSVLYMFTTGLQSGLLGALLTFSSVVWYPIYSNTTAPWRLTPVEDQQLGGLVMWIPAGLVYVCAGLMLFAGWLREAKKRSTDESFAVPNPKL
jgi:putative membrane protein